MKKKSVFKWIESNATLIIDGDEVGQFSYDIEDKKWKFEAYEELTIEDIKLIYEKSLELQKQ